LSEGLRRVHFDRPGGYHAAMSTSLRDQLLKAGLINKKQADEAERQLERQERHERRPRAQQKPAAKHKPAAPAAPVPASAYSLPRVPPPPAPAGQSARLARDLALNKRQQEKAEKKAKAAQIKQLIEKHRVIPPDHGQNYNFVDGSKIRQIAVDAELRQRLGRGELVIVRHEAKYDLVPAEIAARIRERDGQAFVFSGAPAGDAASQSPADDAYEGFTVPDDLMW